MRIRRGENKRESWWITNNTNNVITIGDLPLVPAIQPEKRADILRFYSREKISHSDILVDLVRDGRISLEKQKIFTDNNLPGDVSSRDIEKAITPAEENETGAILYHTTEDNVLIKTDLGNDNLQETNIIIDDNNNLFTPGNINLKTNKNIFLGDNQDSSIYFDGTDLIIEPTNPSFPAALKINNDVEIDGELINNSGRKVGTDLITVDTTLDNTYHEVFCDTNSGNINIFLPEGTNGRKYRIINAGDNDVILNPYEADLLLKENDELTLLDGDILDITFLEIEGWW